MSYRLEGKDIVVSGFEKGIADSPYSGIADMRNVNLTSYPGEASVNFATKAMAIPSAVSSSYTATASTDIFNWAAPGTNPLYPGMAVVLSGNTAGGVSNAVVYYVGAISGANFKLFDNAYFAASNLSPLDITSDGSGTFTSYTMGAIAHRCVDQGQAISTLQNGIPTVTSYVVDVNNRVWMLVSYSTASIGPFTPGSVIFLGNIGSTVFSGDNSICVWNNYLFLFRFNATDIWNMNLQTAPASAWTYGWAGFSASGTATGSLASIVGQDDAIYICNGNKVASILENPGTTFNPATPATYTTTAAALLLPLGEQATCLAELGTSLLVGGIKTFIYPWDRVSTSYSYPIVVAERYISSIVSTNSNAYVFAGNRGNIYITNGTNINLYKKIPDYVSGAQQPYYITGGVASVTSKTTPFGDMIYWRNSLYFSFVAYKNDGTLLTSVTGVWAINLDTNALRLAQKLSYDTYAGIVSAIVPDMQNFHPYGEGLFAAFTDGSFVAGIDNSTNTPYVGGQTVIETDMIPVGTYLNPFSGSQIEWKTSYPLGGNATAETITINYRKNFGDAWTQLGTTTYSTAPTEDNQDVSDVYQVNFQKSQWVQLQVVSTSNATTPTYNRLTEVRIRDWPSGVANRG